jgi:hypothetical protein
MPLFPDFRVLNLNIGKDVNSSCSTSTDNKQNSLSYEDWLYGLEKTLQNCIKKELQDNKGNYYIPVDFQRKKIS